MNQASFLSRVLWLYQDSCQFTDVTLVCDDGRLPAHSAVLAGLFSNLGLTFPSRLDVPDYLLLPHLTMAELQQALRDLYVDNRMDTLLQLLGHTGVGKEEEKNVFTSEDNPYIPTSRPINKADILDVKESASINLNSTRKSLHDDKQKGQVICFKIESEGQEESFQPQTDKSKKIGRPKARINSNGTIGVGKKKLRCSYCRKWVTRHLLTEHLSLNHREKVISNHPEIVFSKPCHECDLMFVGIVDLEQHSLNIHGHSVKEWNCKKCETQFNDLELYKTHARNAHREDIPKFKCPYCDYTSQRIVINNHIYNKHKDKRELHPEIETRYICEHCDETFHGKASKSTHIKISHTANSACPKCSKVCKNVISLELHMLNHLDNQFICELCSKAFKFKNYLQRHVDKFHRGIKIKPHFRFRCTMCIRGNFASEETLQKHILDYHSGVEYQCTQCLKTFARPEQRRLHEQNRHGEKTEKCAECDLMFTTALTLKHHVREVHNKVKDKICSFCGQAFFHDSIFEAHVNGHANNRPWKCERCDKSFLTKRHLKMHTDRHNLPYQCKQCTEKRGCSTELKKHTRRVHGGERLSCRYGCGYQSWQTGNRSRHEADCQLNPIPGAPFSVSSGSASQYTLDIYHARLQNKVD